tara:strand:- start:23 stop:196 length:174 start_codon:yes stop_codon:yes gene_type:complete
MMVELEIEDYSELFDWFTLAFAKDEPKKITAQAKSTFWKLKFLSDDKMKEIEDFKDD